MLLKQDSESSWCWIVCYIKIWNEIKESFGTAPINIELQRYGCIQIPIDERTRISCANEIASETHVLTTYPLYNDVRNRFYQSLSEIYSEFYMFNKITEEEKMCFMLSNPSCVKLVARTQLWDIG